jgi:flagellar biogenesis protein FliO
MQAPTPPGPRWARPLMRFATVLVPEVGQATGPDLTRYALVCALSIAALLALAWVFKRHVAVQLRARASKRALQVLDVLPLAGKQKLVVVRCYDRSFLLGLGEKEMQTIAELEPTAPPVPASAVPPASVASTPVKPRIAAAARSFGTELESELALRPAPPPSLGSKAGVLA